MRNRVMGLLCAAMLGGLGMVAAANAAEHGEKMLAHDVYFSLKDNSPEETAKLIAACKKYLSGHPGTVWFAAGPIGKEFEREVNDRDFDVALHVVFKSKAVHDQYQKAPRHLKFIEECQGNWKKVRVFDSYVEASAHGETGGMPGGPKAAKKAALHEGAMGFAGMVQGRVIVKQKGEILVRIEKIAKQWEHNKAKKADSLVGKTVTVNVRAEEGKPVKNLVAFVESLKPGDTVTLDVAHQEGGKLTLLELTEEQRKSVAK